MENNNKQLYESRSLIRQVFISPEEPRLRAGWRLAAQAVLLAFLALLLGSIWSIGRLTFGLQSTLGFVEAEALSAVAITLSVLIARRWLDHRSVTSLGLRIDRQTWRDLLAGFLIATLMMLVVYAIERLAGWTQVVAVAWKSQAVTELVLALLAMLVVFIITGWQEELYFRGYLLQNLGDGMNLTWGVALSSVIFGLVHLGNPNSLPQSALGISLAGLLMAFGYLQTRRLWLPIGLHIGWNFIEGPILGFPVSGLSTIHLIQIHVEGPIWFTGGAFGPEAGLVLLPGLALGAVLIWIYTKA
jgi:membrane protease YdiL (CAAX protease family)